MTQERTPDWQTRLAALVDAREPFAYGQNDCCLWAARCVDAVRGTDIERQVRERFNYADETSANAVILAGGGLPTLISEFLGEPVRAAFAAPGDVVLARNGDGQAIVGVMIGHHIVAPHATGPLHLPYSAGLLCWKV